MKPNLDRGRRVAAWLGLACLTLLSLSSLSAQEPKLRAVLNGHTCAVVAVAFSPDGKILASAGVDKSVKLWDVATGTERATLQGTEAVWSVAFSSDGENLAAAGGTTSNAPGELKLWDVATGK